jgi:hypothetical protein
MEDNAIWMKRRKRENPAHGGICQTKDELKTLKRREHWIGVNKKGLYVEFTKCSNLSIPQQPLSV